MTLPPLPRLARILVLGLPFALALVPLPVPAQTADREQPINYSADTGDVNYQTKVGALSGNVVITQGTLTIRADKIVFRQNADSSMSATATGNPVSFRQKRDGVDEYYEGYAQRAEYDGAKQLLELFDRALLKRGQDEIRSNYISYNSGTEVFKAEGRAAAAAPGAAPADADTRVRGVFQPKSDLPLPGSKPKEPADPAKAAETEAAGKAKVPAAGRAKTAPPSPSLKPADAMAPAAR
ncbi:MAG: lipopolysaccharide transport periplasmic protein LptA [Betaproteobacteria bacterium]|nr:lipopolysaccharide transport periplasmic protein LptA [Betaproteobacteria bacterium]